LISHNALADLIHVEMLFKGKDLRREINNQGNIDKTICHPKNRICFFINGDKIIVHHNVQTFILMTIGGRGDLWQRRLNKIRHDVLDRKICNFEDLVSACGQGIIIKPTMLVRYV